MNNPTPPTTPATSADAPAQAHTIAPHAAPEFQSDLVKLIPHLRAYSRMLCGRRDLAEDVTQEALVKAWRGRTGFEPGTNMKAWLFTILRNEFYSQKRRSWREMPWDDEKAARIPAAANGQQASLELSDTVRAMRELPFEQREALVLISAGGFSYDEAAAICGTRQGTIKSRVSRARVALDIALNGHRALPVDITGPRLSGYDDILAQLSGFRGLGLPLASTYA